MHIIWGSIKFTLFDAVTSLHVIVELSALESDTGGQRSSLHKGKPAGSGEAAGPADA